MSEEDNFSWAADVTIRAQSAIAIYLNDDGDLVIRAAREWNEEQDEIIIICKNNIDFFLRAARSASKA